MGVYSLICGLIVLCLVSAPLAQSAPLLGLSIGTAPNDTSIYNNGTLASSMVTGSFRQLAYQTSFTLYLRLNESITTFSSVSYTIQVGNSDNITVQYTPSANSVSVNESTILVQTIYCKEAYGVAPTQYFATFNITIPDYDVISFKFEQQCVVPNSKIVSNGLDVANAWQQVPAFPAYGFDDDTVVDRLFTLSVFQSSFIVWQSGSSFPMSIPVVTSSNYTVATPDLNVTAPFNVITGQSALTAPGVTFRLDFGCSIYVTTATNVTITIIFATSLYDAQINITWIKTCGGVVLATPNLISIGLSASTSEIIAAGSVNTSWITGNGYSFAFPQTVSPLWVQYNSLISPVYKSCSYDILNTGCQGSPPTGETCATGFITRNWNNPINIVINQPAFNLPWTQTCIAFGALQTTQVDVICTPQVGSDLIASFEFNWVCTQPMINIGTSSGASDVARNSVSLFEGTAAAKTLGVNENSVTFYAVLPLVNGMTQNRQVQLNVSVYSLDPPGSLSGRSVITNNGIINGSSSTTSVAFTLYVDCTSYVNGAAVFRINYGFWMLNQSIFLNVDKKCPAASGGSGDGLNGGEIFAIILFVFLVVGCVAGCVYNHHNGKTGVHIIPGYDSAADFVDSRKTSKAYSPQIDSKTGGGYGSYQNNL